MISVTILVKNGERHLKKALDSLQAFDEIVLYDTGSTDGTLEIAKSYPNVSIYQRTFTEFGKARNEAAQLAKHSWILSIDSDEVVSSELANEILALSLNVNTIYALPFYNYFNGKHIKWCGWYPEKHVRLYNREKTAFSESMIHEKVMKKDLKEKTLSHPIHHYSYENISDFLIKMERYSSLFAEQYKHKRKSSPSIALYHAMGAFFKSFFLKRGFLGGFEGFLISCYNSHTAFYKYLKLYCYNLKKVDG